jgi:hypothetical protein
MLAPEQSIGLSDFDGLTVSTGVAERPLIQLAKSFS